MVELRRFRSLIDAEIARGFLASHGLHAVVFDGGALGYAEGFPVEVRLMVLDADVEAMREAIHAAGDGKMFAFCRSGHRSTLAWAVAKNEDGVPRKELERCAAEAGYSLDAVAHLLND